MLEYELATFQKAAPAESFKSEIDQRVIDLENKMQNLCTADRVEKKFNDLD